MTEQQWTPEPWIYQPGDSGDASVGLAPYPASIIAEPPDLEEGDVVTVAVFNGTAYVIRDPEGLTEQERHQIELESNGDFSESNGEGIGYREYGDGAADAERAALAVNFVAGYSKEELASMHSLKSVKLLADAQVASAGGLLLDVRDDSVKQVRLLKQVWDKLGNSQYPPAILDEIEAYLREIGVIPQEEEVQRLSEIEHEWITAKQWKEEAAAKGFHLEFSSLGGVSSTPIPGWVDPKVNLMEVGRSSSVWNNPTEVDAVLMHDNTPRFGTSYQYIGESPIPAVLERQQLFKDQWQDKDDDFWLATFIKCTGQLALALVEGDQALVDLELKDIASICLNWLIKRSKA